MKVTPNVITLLGLPLGALAALSLYEGSPLPASLWIALLGGCDLLDGYLAKTRGLATPFGAFLDSTVDRMTEFLLFMGILFFYLREGSSGMAAVTYWALGGSFVISYTRARAENLIQNCRVGFWERPERMVTLLLGLLLGRLKTVLWILAVGTTATVCHRILHTRAALHERDLFSFQNSLFRDLPRKSRSYRLYVLLVILLTLFLKLP